MELELIYDLTVGELRELFAYEDAGDKVGDVWDCIDEDDLERIGYYDNLDEDDDYEDDVENDYDEDDELWDDEDEDEDYYDEDEEDDLDLGEDEVCTGYVLPDPVREETAQHIAADIRAGLYNFSLVKSLYAEDILERIYQLI